MAVMKGETALCDIHEAIDSRRRGLANTAVAQRQFMYTDVCHRTKATQSLRNVFEHKLQVQMDKAAYVSRSQMGELVYAY